MNIHVRILAWIYLLTCGPLLAVGLFICVGLGMDANPSAHKALLFLGPPFLMLAGFVLLPGLIGGIGLLRSRIWARTMLLFLSAYLLLLIPVGTVLGLYGLWTLWKPTAPFLPPVAPGGVPVRVVGRPTFNFASPQFHLIAVMAVVAAGFFLVLKVGFVLHHDPQPDPISSPGLTVLAVLTLLGGVAASVGLAVQSGRRAIDNRRIRNESKERVTMNAEMRRLRVEELAADPARARYAPLVARGEDWSDRNIAYYENPAQLATCEHLQPIERAMRGQGIDVRLFKAQDVSAMCHIDFPALQQLLNAAPPVHYTAYYQGSYDAYDRPTAFLICEEHRSMIHTVHPDLAGQNAPRFPRQVRPE